MRVTTIGAAKSRRKAYRERGLARTRRAAFGRIDSRCEQGQSDVEHIAALLTLQQWQDMFARVVSTLAEGGEIDPARNRAAIAKLQKVNSDELFERQEALWP